MLLPPAFSSDPSTKFGHRLFDEAPTSDLVVVGQYRRTREVKLRTAAAQAFAAMAASAKKDGLEIVPISGFRPISYQKGLFERARKRYGSAAQAARWVAPPGYSEHATGMTLDVGDAAAPSADVDPSFEKTKVYAWLERHAAEFGFEISFPRNNVQGVNFEPWHWRFIGNAEAREIFRKK